MEADPPLFDECSAETRTPLEDEESAKKRSAVRQTSFEEDFAKRGEETFNRIRDVSPGVLQQLDDETLQHLQDVIGPVTLTFIKLFLAQPNLEALHNKTFRRTMLCKLHTPGETILWSW